MQVYPDSDYQNSWQCDSAYIVSVSQANHILGIQYLSDGKIQELDVETKNSEIVMDIFAINRREKTKINTEVYVNF